MGGMSGAAEGHLRSISGRTPKGVSYENCIDTQIVIRMNEVTLSPKYQIVIPLEIRKALGLKPGQKIQAIRLGERIELIPIRPIAETKGFVKGIDTDVERDDDRL